MESNLARIKEIMLKKSSAKQLAFRNTKEVFAQIRTTATNLAKELQQEVNEKDPSVEIKFYEKSEYEVHLKFSGDTLVFMMHTNIFSFEPSHYLFQSDYVKKDSTKQFCGMIQIYNFLADSIKYNREGDQGYLVGRLFVNKENHFFIEGKRPLSIRYSDLSKETISLEIIQFILLECMQFCLNFDLIVPPVEQVNLISVEQKNLMSYSSGIPTGKMMGFRNQNDQD